MVRLPARLGTLTLLSVAWALGCGDEDEPTTPEEARVTVNLSLQVPSTFDATLNLHVIRAAAARETLLVSREITGAFEPLAIPLALEPGPFLFSSTITGKEERAAGETESGLLYRGHKSLVIETGNTDLDLSLVSLVPHPLLTMEANRYTVSWDSIAGSVGYDLYEESQPRERSVVGTHAVFLFDSALRRGGELRYKVRARLETAVSAYSEIIPVDLPPPTPPAAIVDLHVMEELSDARSITLGWTAPGDDGDTGTAARYDIRWSNDPITESSFDAAPGQLIGVPNVAGTNEVYTIRELTPSTLYYFAVITSDEYILRSPISNVLEASTDAPPDSLPPATISDLLAHAQDENSAELTWSAPSDDGASVSEYEIRYDNQPITLARFPELPSIAGPAPGAPGSEESVIARDLLRETDYYFAIVSRDEEGNSSELSNIASTRTPDLTAPANVRSLAVRQVGSTTALLTWTAVGDDGAIGTAAAYDLRRSLTPIDEGSFEAAESLGAAAPQSAGTPERFDVAGLMPSTSYYFALRVIDESGNESALSNSVRATTSD